VHSNLESLSRSLELEICLPKVRGNFTGSPANALAGDNEVGRARRFGAAIEESVGGDDQDEQGDDRDQINLSGVVTTVADFPAH
jgi:hypothetical protein